MKQLIISILVFFLSIPVFSQSTALAGAAATVNLIRTEPISVIDLRKEVERMEKAAGRALTQAERLQVLDVMINERLILQAADRDKVITGIDNEVNQQLLQLRNQIAQRAGRQPTDAEFAQAITNESGLDFNTFKEQLRRQKILERYLRHKKGDLSSLIKSPTDAEINAEFSLRRTEFVRPETIRFTIIQVPYGEDNASKAASRTLAESLVREIQDDPSNFDEVVLRGGARNSNYRSGDWGYLPRNAEARQMVGQEFIDVAFNLKQGQVSRLIEGVQGFQIIKVSESYRSKQLELLDVVQPGTRVTVKEYIGQMLLNQRQQAVLSQVTQELVSELRTSRTFQIFPDNINW